MKQSKTIFIAVAACLLFSSSDVVAQRTRGVSSGSSGGRVEIRSRSVTSYSSSSNSSGSNYSYNTGGQSGGGCVSYSDAFRNLDNYYRMYSTNNNNHGGSATIGYREVDYNNKSSACSLFDVFAKENVLRASYPIYGYEVSKRKATKGSLLIPRSSGDLYYRDGIFFSKSLRNTRKFVINKPCSGIHVPYIPTTHREYIVDETTYYYFYGTFYVYDASACEYVVVAPPVGLTVNKLPDYAKKVVVDGQSYYIVDNVVYKAVGTDGKDKYEVTNLDRKTMYYIKDYFASAK